MDNVIAKVYLSTGRVEVSDMILCRGGLKFRCLRCASLCCRLGGPPLTQRDVDRIRKMGYDADFFLNRTSPKRFGRISNMVGVMENRKDGSCIFLNEEDGVYECSIYEYRPALCRLYPFYFEVVGSRSLLLKFIPCCNGLNDPAGRPIDEGFISRFLMRAIMDLLHAGGSCEIGDWESE
ncbi:MAG: YkgJ family cysteine cluster protein [Candidatus Bathyarchaeia archaeon]